MVAAALAFLGLRQVASSMHDIPAGGHSHGTAEQPAADDHAPTNAPTTGSTPGARVTPATKPTAKTPQSDHSDGHAY